MRNGNKIQLNKVPIDLDTEEHLGQQVRKLKYRITDSTTELKDEN